MASLNAKHFISGSLKKRQDAFGARRASWKVHAQMSEYHRARITVNPIDAVENVLCSSREKHLAERNFKNQIKEGTPRRLEMLLSPFKSNLWTSSSEK
jgi:hypothetical protein